MCFAGELRYLMQKMHIFSTLVNGVYFMLLKLLLMKSIIFMRPAQATPANEKLSINVAMAYNDTYIYS